MRTILILWFCFISFITKNKKMILRAWNSLKVWMDFQLLLVSNSLHYWGFPLLRWPASAG
jgi:hypothetical protein